VSTPDIYAGMAMYIRDREPGGLDGLFRPGANLEIARLYRNGYYRNIREVLSSSFPVVVQCLGMDNFTTLAKNYGQAQPPERGTLTDYGGTFANWLADQMSPEQSWVADLARLDWAWLECLHGVDSKPVAATELLTARDPEDVQVRRLENSRLLKLEYSLLDFWTNTKLGKDEHRVVTLPNSINLEDQWVIFWRPEMTVYSRELKGIEAQLLEALASGKHVDTGGTDADELSVLFGQWLNAGVLQKCTREHEK